MLLSEEELVTAQEGLSNLLGLPLSDMWRYAGCQKFEFGEQKPHLNSDGEEVTWADYGLVVSCYWTIQGSNGFELTWNHFGPAPERRDEHAYPFYGSLDDAPPVVKSVAVEENGGVRIEMTGGYSLAFEPSPYDEDHCEQWRFMPPEEDLRGHLVLEETGLAWSQASGD